jgi:hypothetical protein
MYIKKQVCNALKAIAYSGVVSIHNANTHFRFVLICIKQYVFLLLFRLLALGIIPSDAFEDCDFLLLSTFP